MKTGTRNKKSIESKVTLSIRSSSYWPNPRPLGIKEFRREEL